MLVLVSGLGGAARAQVIAEPAPLPFPDPKKFAKGLFVTGELGAIVFLGREGRYAAPGPVIGAKIGYDLFRWLALQGHLAGASTDANLPPPTIGQTFQSYFFLGEARFSVPIRRFKLFGEGGGGVALVSTNVLDQVGVTHGRATVAVVGGGGMDYHTLNRHFSLGLVVDYMWLGNFTNSHALTFNGYLRYTQ
jgi:hypothetical protein